MAKTIREVRLAATDLTFSRARICRIAFNPNLGKVDDVRMTMKDPFFTSVVSTDHTGMREGLRTLTRPPRRGRWVKVTLNDPEFESFAKAVRGSEYKTYREAIRGLIRRFIREAG